MVKKVLALALATLMLLATGCTVQQDASNETQTTLGPTEFLRKPSPEELGQKDDTETSKDPIVDSEIPADQWTTLVDGGVAQFVVVSDSTEYDDMAEKLASDLATKTKASFQYKTSAQKNDPSLLSKNRIILGEALSKVLDEGETLSYNGKLSRLDTKSSKIKIHITGNHKDAVEYSVQKFLSGCLNRYVKYDDNHKVNFKVPNPRIFFLEENFENYANTSPKLLGRDLADYKIVFSENATAIERYMAKYLINEIGCNTGYVMKTVSDASAESEYEIVFGQTNRAASQALYDTLASGQYAIKSVGNSIYIAYDNYLVASDARNALNSLYLRNTATAINLTEKPDHSANALEKKDDSHIRVMTSNIVCAGDANGREIFDQGLGITWQDRVGLQGNMMMAYLPDFVGLQEMQEGDTYGVALMQTELLKTVSSEYSFVSYEGMANNTYWNPILYRHTVWQIEAKDVMYPENFDNAMHRWQWALFSRIDDPTEQYIVLNLHYPTSSNYDAQIEAAKIVNEKIKELMSDYPMVPIFVTGDFNSAYDVNITNAFLQTIDGTTMAPSNPQNGVIDHVVYDQNFMRCEQKYAVNDEFMVMTSDHRPHFADFSWK